jgi:hypothetical protein
MQRRAFLRGTVGASVTGLSARRAQAEAQAVRKEIPKEGGARIFALPLVVYIPPWHKPASGKTDIVVHFHGNSPLQEANFAESELNAICVSINVGVVAGSYGTFARDGETMFQHILDRAVAVSEIQGATAGRVALSAWSAGFGGVRPLLQVPAIRERVDATFLADGLFTSYIGKPSLRHIHDAPLRGTFEFAAAAAKGEKLFILTHTAIPTVDYPSVAETTELLLKQLAIEKQPLAPIPHKPIYEAKKAQLTVLGYSGTSKGAHIEQIKLMGSNMYKSLRSRWS